MQGFATFQVLGTCSEDVKLDKLPNGRARASISVVVNTPEQDADGNWIERATWMRFALFGKSAESKNLTWCKKGTAVGVYGTIQSYQQEIDGKKYTMHNFRPDRVRPAGTKPKDEAGAGGADEGFPGEYDGPETR